MNDILKNPLIIRKYDFNQGLIKNLNDNKWVKDLYPIVYIISDLSKMHCYIGETTDCLKRMSNHLNNPSKNKLKQVHLISSPTFNKSAALEIESSLIKYIGGDGLFETYNLNVGIANHNFYQKDVYEELFKIIWDELKREKLVKNDLVKINNSDLFKYSPYKSLGEEQMKSLLKIIIGLISKKENTILVEGGAGTGKTILAIYLFKLLTTDLKDFNIGEIDIDVKEVIELITLFRNKFSNPQMALVVPMQSLRATLQKVFKNIKGLSPSMVIGPAEVSTKKFDIIIVDESHRLRRRSNLGTYFKAFDDVNKKLKLKDTNNELDWVLKQATNRILFYDANQSIKPSDVRQEEFDKIKKNKKSLCLKLKSQFRIKSDVDYIGFINKLFNCDFNDDEPKFDSSIYEFLIFNSLDKMVSTIKKKDQAYGLCRLVAGIAWKWDSKKDIKKKDIIIDNVKLIWNSVAKDWINSKNAHNEVGCIHTTQGYDLNYCGIIIGEEISYDKLNNKIVIKSDKYLDKAGKQSVKSETELRNYIINIYKTIMYRGIRGTYLYICDKDLREYFQKHILTK